MDSQDRVVAEKDASGTITSEIIWDGDLPSKYIFGGKTYSYVCNAHGDVVALLDEDGKTVNSYKYDIWGQLLESNETVPNAIRYNHEYYDTESGFYYLRGRYYDPSIRRFTTPDPAEDGINWYAYCGNNPVDFIDPSGYKYFAKQEVIGTNVKMTQYYSGSDLEKLYNTTSEEEINFKYFYDAFCALGATLSGAIGPLIGFGKWLDDFQRDSSGARISDAAQRAIKTGGGIIVTTIYTISPIFGARDRPAMLRVLSKAEVAEYDTGKKKI